MPNALDMELARPLCPRRVINKTPGNRQHAVHTTCYKPMRYDHRTQLWLCTECGNEEPVAAVTARRAGYA